MTARTTAHYPWPKLVPFESWKPTFDTLLRWLQIVGKIRLSTAPWTNHSWHVPLYVTARGLTTRVMHLNGVSVELEFDFIDQHLLVSTSTGQRHTIALASKPVARFYQELGAAMSEVGAPMKIWTQPVEIPDAAERFESDYTHETYDADAAASYWQAVLQTQRVFEIFRARYLGKVSPVHFFWGAADLAVSRFSGRSAPRHPGGAPNCADWVMREAYSHEVSSAGFFAGGQGIDAAFYSYAYPEPEGFRAAAVKPADAHFHQGLGEFLLPYEAVRTSADPDAALLAFLQSTYNVAADLGAWDRAALEFDGPDRT